MNQAKILIVDDEVANVRLLEVTLREAGYQNVFGITDSRETYAMFCGIQPDLVLLDLNMPHLDGAGVMQQLEPELKRSSVPILVLTADATSAAKYHALEAGASDFLTKPFETREVLLRIGILLQVRFHSVLLQRTVAERTKDLELAQLETVQRLALAAEFRDDDTGLHAKRVGSTSGCVAQCLGFTVQEAGILSQAAALHDVGKIGISDSILLKPGRLTNEEFTTMKEHTKIGARILSGSISPVLSLGEEIAMYHHEKWDGSGYWGLVGEEIPLAARIVAVADAFDAMTHARPYKVAMSREAALGEIASETGRHFDGEVAAAFLKCLEKDVPDCGSALALSMGCAAHLA